MLCLDLPSCSRCEYAHERENMIWCLVLNWTDPIAWRASPGGRQKGKAEKTGNNIAQELKELNAEKRSVKVGIYRFHVSCLLFQQRHRADIPAVLQPSVLLQYQSLTCLWTGIKKKKSVFKLMHPFPELHKEGIKQTGNHPNRRIKTDGERLKFEKRCYELSQRKETAKRLI